jgi:ABC-type tungstate transport system substrate-binding protein
MKAEGSSSATEFPRAGIGLMSDSTSAFHFLLTADPSLFAIVWLSLPVSLTATAFASIIGMPLAQWSRSRGFTAANSSL